LSKTTLPINCGSANNRLLEPREKRKGLKGIKAFSNILKKEIHQKVGLQMNKEGEIHVS
jgi:hypothetical protein